MSTEYDVQQPNPFRASVTLSLPITKIILQYNASKANYLKIKNNKYIVLGSVMCSNKQTLKKPSVQLRKTSHSTPM
jgi:hypothetical protein